METLNNVESESFLIFYSSTILASFVHYVLNVFQTKALPPPYKGSGSEFCLVTEGSDFINPLTRYNHYSRMACVSECDINQLVQACGCRFFLDPGKWTKKTCTVIFIVKLF